jgi:hypothetical protein
MLFPPKVHWIDADTMTGGYGMYIHSYQIHNVLNVYRQQLSRGTPSTPRNASGNTDRNEVSSDPVRISEQGQRETLFEKISSEIVQRITQFGPNTDSDSGVLAQSGEAKAGVHDKAKAYERKSAVFSYTQIDNNNQKATHNLSIRQLNNSNYSTEKARQLIKAPSITNSAPDSE